MQCSRVMSAGRPGHPCKQRRQAASRRGMRRQRPQAPQPPSRLPGLDVLAGTAAGSGRGCAGVTGRAAMHHLKRYCTAACLKCCITTRETPASCRRPTALAASRRGLYARASHVHFAAADPTRPSQARTDLLHSQDHDVAPPAHHVAVALRIQGGQVSGVHEAILPGFRGRRLVVECGMGCLPGNTCAMRVPQRQAPSRMQQLALLRQRPG